MIKKFNPVKNPFRGITILRDTVKVKSAEMVFFRPPQTTAHGFMRQTD